MLPVEYPWVSLEHSKVALLTSVCMPALTFQSLQSRVCECFNHSDAKSRLWTASSLRSTKVHETCTCSTDYCRRWESRKKPFWYSSRLNQWTAHICGLMNMSKSLEMLVLDCTIAWICTRACTTSFSYSNRGCYCNFINNDNELAIALSKNFFSQLFTRENRE